MPDATTVWLFRERLVKAKAIDRLFARFDAALTDRGYLAMGGQIIDATVVPAPKQRNTEEEKAAIKEGRIPERWKDKPAKIRQKDRDLPPGGPSLITRVLRLSIPARSPAQARRA
ncbi:hypothetical protein SAMN06296065_1348 [Novosphingobium panipatense]|uniref:DDE family transposase n=1 Tax=Novosphingobium panipatense TaxID=428991 RepID=A0ABY1QX12_9SPHN|nr:hypothetical protein SAMN06296065_1348 [Novosphingobium panipatense]